ncbi:Omp28 family outer membrane lipoprotein [bacterium]|nr:Omp28 family outer membrane lipoprotein [bacterium]
MMTLKKYLLLVLAVGYSFNSCDVIEEPFLIEQEVVSDSCEAFIFPTQENYVKKVLLEDYTGHTCGNCPRAAEKADELKETYQNQLVVMAVHAGWFSNSSNSYPTDFTTDVGDSWNEHFGNSQAGNPNGMINRIEFPSSHIFQYTQWEEKIGEQLEEDPTVGLQIKSSYDSLLNLICIDVQTKILSSLSNEINITVVLLENKIISKQTDYAAENDYIEDYEHKHVLRKGLNGAWGEPIGDGLYTAYLKDLFGLTGRSPKSRAGLITL